MYEERFMRRAIELSKSALTTPGTKPFGGVVVKDGEIVGEGLNHSLEHFDPTSHGEVEAIRDACRRLRTLDLTGAHMYASTEPCALCVAAMVLTGFAQAVLRRLARSGRSYPSQGEVRAWRSGH